MSDFIDRLNAVKDDLETAVPKITAVVGYRNPVDVDAELFPWATIFNPEEENVPEDFQQYTRRVTIRVVYVRAQGEFAEAADDLDAFRDELESAPLLAGSVPGAHRISVTRRLINETQDETGRLRAALELAIEEEDSDTVAADPKSEFWLTSRMEQFGIGSPISHAMVVPEASNVVGFTWAISAATAGGDTTFTFKVNRVTDPSGTFVIPAGTPAFAGGFHFIRRQVVPGDILEVQSDGGTTGLPRLFLCWRALPISRPVYSLKSDVAMQSHEIQFRTDNGLPSLPYVCPFDSTIESMHLVPILTTGAPTQIQLDIDGVNTVFGTLPAGVGPYGGGYVLYPTSPIAVAKGQQIVANSDGGDTTLSNICHFVCQHRVSGAAEYPVGTIFVPQAHDSVQSGTEASAIVAPVDGELIEVLYNLDDELDFDNAMDLLINGVDSGIDLTLRANTPGPGVFHSQSAEISSTVLVTQGDVLTQDAQPTGGTVVEADVLWVFQPA